MQVSHKGIELVKRFEGFISKAYLCPAGYLTAGYGHRSNVTKDTVMTEEEAENLLKKDLNQFASKITYSLEQDHITVNQNQFDALCSFAFNLGYSALVFSTLWKKLKQGDYEGASNEFTKWVYITKTDKLTGERFKLKLKGLEQRRKAEQELFNL
jgi:lysozyme